jgi:hypothetical protein
MERNITGFGFYARYLGKKVRTFLRGDTEARRRKWA